MAKVEKDFSQRHMSSFYSYLRMDRDIRSWLLTVVCRKIFGTRGLSKLGFFRP